ncbi:MAG TPA: hypothetical protein VMP08_08275, partial [Anaerolineae bacterium]|nr:hypothetical protein [Anaerolineae bacterium]
AVERGRQIALSSNSGTGAYHLHFEVRYNGEDGPVLDPYGWLGPWQTDPWGQPFQHTADWWRSNDPIPMGFRDQNHAANGPFQLIGAIRDKWDALDGEPGSPVSAQTSGSCPGTYGDCQLFEKGYIRWDYSATAYSPYGATFLPDVKDENGWISTIVVRNNGSTAAQGSILFYDPAGHTIDSRTYIAVPPGGSWSLDTSAVFDTNQIWGVADTFSGSAVVYANRDVAVKAENQSPMANISYVGNQTPTTTAYLPNLVVRTTRQAYVSLQNAGANAATVSLNFYNRNGGLVHSRNETIPVNGSTMLLLNNIPDIVNGFAATSNTGSMFASVTNSVPIAVSAQVNYTDQNGAYAYGGVSTGDTTLWTPGVFRRVSGSTWLLYSAVNVQNLSASTTTIHVQFVNRSGTVTYEFDDTVAARSSVAYNTRYQGTTPSYIWNPLIAALGDDWAGSVRVSSNSGAPLAGVYLYFPAQYGTDMIAVPLTGQSQLTTGSLIAPAVYRQQSGSIWTHWTTVLVQNTTDNAASITVRIFDSAGNLQGNACTLSVPRLSYAALHLKTGVDLTPCNLLNTLGTNFTGSMLITSNDSRALLAIYYDFYESTGRISGDAATVRP